MVAGHLQEKNNFYYIVLSYKDETDIRRTGFCKEKTKKYFVGIQEIPSPHITVYQRNTMTEQKTIAA